MLNKKIILLISLLLVTGSSYIIFHRKKNNNDEINIIDNSDNSINDNVNEDNQEELINENAESSGSLLLVIIIIIVIIVIAAAIVFFIFYRRNKKKKEEKEDNFFEEYEKFKEIEANKTKIAQETKKEITEELVTLFLKDVGAEYQDSLQKNQMKEYNPNKYIIDFFYGQLKPFKEKGLILYHFNGVKHVDLLKKIIFNFFGAIKSDEYNNDNFKSKDEENKKNIMYLFIATIIEPFFEIISKNDISIFVNQKNNNVLALVKNILNRMLLNLSSEEKIKEKDNFVKYVLESNIFPSIFNKLIRKYFPFDFSNILPNN